MRPTLVALALVAVALSPSVHAGVPHPFVVLVMQAPDHATTLVSWAPIVGASTYVVFRGPTVDTLQPVQYGPETYYIDSNGAGMVYVVHALSMHGSSSQSSPSGGDCVSSSPQGVSVDSGSCVHSHS